MTNTTDPKPDRVTEIYEAIDAFQRTHRLPGLQHAQIRSLLAEHLARVLPPVSSSGRAALLHETAGLGRLAEQLVERCPEHGCVEPEWGDGCHCELVPLLRRVAAEEQPTQTQARPLYHRWYTETRDGVVDEWAPGMRFTNRAEALDRYRTVSARHPLWKDGTPVERRFVRETTSYTVEEPERPVVGEQPDTQETP